MGDCVRQSKADRLGKLSLRLTFLIQPFSAFSLPPACFLHRSRSLSGGRLLVRGEGVGGQLTRS